jgi:hypothetical protein
MDTLESITATFHWKTVKKMMKRDFPFILDVKINEPELKIYNTIFLEVYINPFVFCEIYDTKIQRYYLREFMPLNKDINIMFLSVGFTISENLNNDIMEKIKYIFHITNKSLPQELKIPSKRIFDISGFFFSKDSQLPPDLNFKNKSSVKKYFDIN